MQDEKHVRRVLHDFLVAQYLPSSAALGLADDDNLFDAGVLDSAGLLALLAWVEEKFDFDIPDDHLLPENFDTVSRTASYICTRRSVQESSQCASA